MQHIRVHFMFWLILVALHVFVLTRSWNWMPYRSSRTYLGRLPCRARWSGCLKSWGHRRAFSTCKAWKKWKTTHGKPGGLDMADLDILWNMFCLKLSLFCEEPTYFRKKKHNDYLTTEIWCFLACHVRSSRGTCTRLLGFAWQCLRTNTGTTSFLASWFYFGNPCLLYTLWLCYIVMEHVP